MRNVRVLLALAAGLFLAVSCTAVREAAPGPPPSETVQVTLLHVNDVHGQTEPYGLKGRSVGGYARLATLVDEERAASKAARVFLIHAGDELSRGDDLTRATLGAANMAIMNHLKFDIYLPGNGDHYDGPDVLLAMLRRAKFPVLSANVTVAATGQPIGKPYIIEQAGPVRVAFLGLCLVKADHESSALYIMDYPFTVAEKLVPELRKQADVVVVVSHLGALRDVELAELVPGIDVIIGAHSHTEMPEGVRMKGPDGREVLIAQAGEQLRFLGKIGLTLGRSGGAWRLVSTSAALIPMDAAVRLDPTVTALIARLSAAAPKPKEPRLAEPEPAEVP